MAARPVIDVGTISQMLHHRYTVTVWCPTCRCRGPELDLNRHVLQGRGGLRPIDLHLRHARCRTLLQLTISPPKGYGK